MKKVKVALINNVNYCKFPDGIADIKAFIDYLNKNYHSFVKLDFYSEEGCVAPFFIEEDLKMDTQYYNPSNIRWIRKKIRNRELCM